MATGVEQVSVATAVQGTAATAVAMVAAGLTETTVVAAASVAMEAEPAAAVVGTEGAVA